MALDIFNPQISVLSYDLSGKTILVYGTNRTGKTKQLTRLPKPLYLAFEQGANGIGGIPFLAMTKWSDYISFVRQITTEKNLKQAKEIYQTLILDGVSIMGKLCAEYICEKYDADSIGSGKKGYGLWSEWSAEFEKQIRLMMSAGFTVAFIAHEGTRTFNDENGNEYTKIYPSGDKRIIDPVCDMVDIIAYAAVNGIDEKGQEIKSSLFMTNTRKYHAGSRFDYLVGYLPEFTAENLQTAVSEAIRLQEEMEGTQAVSFEVQAAAYKTEETSFEDLQESIKEIAMQFNEDGRIDEYRKVVEDVLGKGKGVSEAKPDQKQMLEVILANLQSL